MRLSCIQLVILLFMIPDTYVYYKYMAYLFGAPYVRKGIMLLAYTGYYLMLCALYLFSNIPLVLIAYNIIVCTGITFMYHACFTKKVLAAVLYCLILTCIEFAYFTIFAHTSSVRDRSFTEGSVWQAVIVKLTEYVAAYILAIFLNKRNDVYLPGLLRFRITLVPIVSLCATVIFLHFNIGVQKTIVLIMTILIINIIVVLLYVEVSAEYADQYQHLIIKKQNEYYVNQFKLLKESVKFRNAEKHDFKNHLSVIAALMQKNEQEEAAAYIDKIINVYKSVREPYNSGNLVIDSVLNYKTQEAAQYEIPVNVGLSVPEDLQVNSFDMTTILGNILDNAINAAKMLERDKFIDLKIRYDKGRLLIKIDNPFNGEIKYENNKLVTLHPDREDHGIGLNNVRSVLEKYDGTLEIEHTDNLFSVSLMLFV